MVIEVRSKTFWQLAVECWQLTFHKYLKFLRIHRKRRSESFTPAFFLHKYKYPKVSYYNIGAITNATTDINFNKMFKEGPEVSLNGSPTVSPTTAALCGSEPL